jgi:hypothetical protein
LVVSGLSILAFPMMGLVDALVPTEIGIGVAAIVTCCAYAAVGVTKRKNITPEKTRQLHISIVTLVVLLGAFYIFGFLVFWLSRSELYGYLILLALLFGLYGIWVIFDRKTGLNTRIPLWLYSVVIVVTLLLDTYTTLLIALVPTVIVYGIGRLADRILHRTVTFPFWMYLIVWLPVFLFAYHTFGIFWGG